MAELNQKQKEQISSAKEELNKIQDILQGIYDESDDDSDNPEEWEDDLRSSISNISEALYYLNNH